jgi:hypothetical protein
MQFQLRQLLELVHRWSGHSHSGRDPGADGPDSTAGSPRPGRTRTRRYKYQALVTPLPQQATSPEAGLPGPVCRAVVRVDHPETHLSKLFSALVTTSEDSQPLKKSSTVVTVVVVGDDADDYLFPGEHFALWRGGDVARGTVTRRLFV